MRINDAGSVPRIFGGRTNPAGMPLGAPSFGAKKARVEGSSSGEVSYIDTPSQEDALGLIAKIMEEGAMAAEIQGLARAITKGCPARNDWCELRAIFEAVKNGRKGSRLVRSRQRPALPRGRAHRRPGRTDRRFLRADPHSRDAETGRKRRRLRRPYGTRRRTGKSVRLPRRRTRLRPRWRRQLRARVRDRADSEARTVDRGRAGPDR